MRVDVDDGIGQVAVAEVYLNDVLVQNCTFVDTEEGYLERYKPAKDGKGLMTVESNHGTRLVKEPMLGNVRIVFAPGWGMDAENQYHLNGERVESRQVR